MSTQPWWTRGVDITQPSAARVYDVHLGGSHNFDVDRRVAEETARRMPELPAVLRANRSLLRRMVRYLARHGITQFLDLGSGIPTAGNVHEIAQRENPRCRVVYVDYDLVAVAHSRALLRGNERATILHADFRDPDEVLDSDEVNSLLDLGKPVAVLMLAVLHFLPDEEHPAKLTANYIGQLPPGSCLAISHACDDDADAGPREAAEMYSRRIGGFWMRSQEQIAALFDDLPLVPPGLVTLDEWRPDSEESGPTGRRFPGRAAIGRKP